MIERGQGLSGYTISVVSHGHGTALYRMLDQLAAFSPLPDRIVVTLNLQSEGFEASRYKGMPLTVIRNESPKGFGSNHNAAFQHCQSDWFAVLNPDLSFDLGNPFGSLLRRARELPRAGAVAPRILGPNRTPEDAIRDTLTPWSLVQRVLFRRRVPASPEGIIRRPGSFHWLAGMFMLLNASAFREMRGFDERFFLYCEDFDLCSRLYAAGFSMAIDSDSAVIHDAQRDSHRSARHLAWHLESLCRVWLSRAFWRLLLIGRRGSEPSLN